MKNFLIRIECFGGIIVNLNDFSRIELNISEALYLKALELSNNHIIAKSVHDKLITNKNYDLNRFKKINLIKELENGNINKNFEETFYLVKNKYDNCKDKKMLSAPMEIVFYPTLKCNLNCRFCFVNNINSKQYAELDYHYWLALAKKAKENDVLSISILGGEPTLYKDIDKLLEGIEKIGILTTITTNGISMNKSTIDILANSEYITPVVSLQALSKLNESLTGSNFDKAVKTIKEFSSRGKNVRVNTVYTEQTDEELYDLIDFCVDSNVERFSIATYFGNNEKNTLNCNHNLVSSRMLDDKISIYLDKKHSNADINYSIEGCMLYSAYPEIESEIENTTFFENQYYGCRAANTKVEVYVDGSFLPCIMFETIEGCTKLVNIDDFNDKWYNDNFFNKLRITKTQNKTCLDCGFYSFCNGGCPADRIKLHNDNYFQFRDGKCAK